ncbi:phosphatase PAP2 family protein [Kitasatospora sp. NPDC059463]|uniref:phosphatase PAP2 family protein n=1 Tax=unclassified Kitasatospora TaxID=2633591 RepID=UPI00368ED7DF
MASPTGSRRAAGPSSTASPPHGSRSSRAPGSWWPWRASGCRRCWSGRGGGGGRRLSSAARSPPSASSSCAPHLDTAPPTSGFPSGHVGAAVALDGAPAVLAALRVRGRMRPLLCVLAALLAALVAFSRLYRGMHHPADVLAGPVNGGAALWIMWRAFLADRGRSAGATWPVRPPAGRSGPGGGRAGSGRRGSGRGWRPSSARRTGSGHDRPAIRSRSGGRAEPDGWSRGQPDRPFPPAAAGLISERAPRPAGGSRR